MNLKVLLILGLLAMLTATLEIPCTLYLYPSKPDPENLYDTTKSFVLPFGKVQIAHEVKLPLNENLKFFYATQYHKKPINSVKYIVAQGNQCDLCWINTSIGPNLSVFVDPPRAGEIYTLDNCNNFIGIGCDYLYPGEV